ncbi:MULTISPECIES: 1-(5-phosphoribosyl)-5-[(5-phosphoribosylamino)methylideneamino]imidazole-4-carboxamide isomerase [unclassified Leisingera]|uniref:1-(5-phosphoribosyl)-5-[(5- phosphoribosylamino)methylideneamino]imidazole-4- carboxamide isomerase n=1 Tax=unclassified Leisingera TaxID=2614906 RepID=UPI0002F4D734|nr:MULTISPECIES: 1-(5-phosphoribosyl)-5-[(5-phosphoribosylamino)methylideneamino] imidazole-4-carboxamide isomerase [unclassified Leisingera]KIC25364.1 1-(5-phosphoribosyl)-5-[(5-phosphoribosylamino)methylideneamino] imidazole-4-carboxamide isomerase [Leisingera sp. ANG-S3]KIC29592.1 1-(5-phosphoribosyl)-5-[(5-phosphoribosylamino)methylideneamino] imidazole-4-carboxamide isomerase [Leisingera sp. ANG-M6]KIC34757.1 1-(5-phosphoribosyl)-5-[(5-phosphoribosylamino)methylideneamino] imidazole-4-carbo
MIIYPTMQIQNGRCVTLEKGRLDEPQIWHVDPVETAKGFAAAGAEWMHLTDFNALEGDNSNEELVTDIIRAAGIPVQLGGGMRSREQVEYWIDKGAGRVVIGTLAARDPHLVRELAEHHPDQIVLAVDIWQGQVMTDGWRKSGAFTPEAYLEAFAGAPFAGILITDIDADVADTEAQMGLISHLASLVKLPVIASGVVRNADDISRLKYIHNIAGAQIGRALFSKTIALEDALAVARPEPEPVAEFQ